MMLLAMGRFILKHWIVFAVLGLALALFGAGWKIKAKLEADLAQRNALLAENAALKTTIALERNAAQAAQEARTRNDDVLPEVRERTKARIDRADTASDADRVRDDEQAVADYARAASGLRGKSAN